MSSSMIGKPVVVSFWAKTPEAGQTVRAQLQYPSAVDNFATTTNFETITNTITSSWTRYTATFSPLTASFVNGLELRLGTNSSGSATHDLYITGVQLEAGTVANDFRRNANSLQGELEACQRYYYTWQNSSATMGQTIGNAWYAHPQTHLTEMRVAPAATTLQGISTLYGNGTSVGVSSLYAGPATTNNTRVFVIGASLGSSPSLYSVWCSFDSHTIAFSAEL
jgi:hypothetical protein